jgi:uncharacterized Rossmann fold enzyme
MATHVVFVRVGTKYSPEYVRILSDMLARNLSERADIIPWCITDDPDSLPEDVEAIAHDPSYPGWWAKLQLFSPDMPWDEGDRIAYFDLDVAITGRLEKLVEHKGIIKDIAWPGFNSSVMVWDHGEHRQIWDLFTLDMIDKPSEALKELLPKGQVNGGDQEWITHIAPEFPLLPTEWCASYRWQAKDWPTADAKVVLFHGDPKPHTITEGWVPQIWKIGGLHQLPAADGVNVTDEVIRANVLSAIARDLPWFTGHPAHKDTAVICCGGPSLRESLENIRFRKRHGGRIISVNNTLSFLLENGIKPDSHVMLDARPENAAFVREPPQGVRYLIASQCDPSVFDALADQNVLVWHNMSVGMEPLFEPHVLAMMRGDEGAKPMVLVPGGGTVGLRAICLAWLSGYRKIHVYGMDGSFRDNAHHAYPQALNDGDRPLEVQLGPNSKRYRCAPWMVRQAHEFHDAYTQLSTEGVSIVVHGEGLIPDMARALRAERQAA